MDLKKLQNVSNASAVDASVASPSSTMHLALARDFLLRDAGRVGVYASFMDVQTPQNIVPDTFLTHLLTENTLVTRWCGAPWNLKCRGYVTQRPVSCPCCPDPPTASIADSEVVWQSDIQ